MNRKRAATMIAAVAACLVGGVARSEAPAKPRGAGRGPTAAEFAALKQKVDEQSELLMKLSQLEGQHYEFLLRLLQSTGRPGTPSALPPPAPSASPSLPASPAPSSSSESDSSVAKPKLATITGRVDVRGKPWGPIYVYVDNIKEPAVDRNAEIVQRDRGFVPSVLLVQKGTRVSFPNADPFLHNVFSPSATHPFDLGSYRQGDKAGVVRLFNPGVVEVLCNMHAKMRANVLVVPNRYHVKTSSDGTFRLENVPVGTRQLVAWTPDAKPMTESVALTPAGASVRFALQVDAAPAPVDKMGKIRSGYRPED
jgi:plastocyanin